MTVAARPPVSTPTADRRVAVRRQPAMGTVFRFDPVEDVAHPIGLVWNLSLSGISMLLTDPPEPGAVHTGLLEREFGGHRLPVTFTVVHVRMVETGDYIMGGHFARRLTADELRPFVV